MTIRYLLLAVMISAPVSAAPVTRLTNINNSYPHPSPDGTRIVFQSDRTGVPQVYVMSADGSDLRQLTDLSLGAETPVWSPDGKLIAFAAYVGEADNDVFVMAADGTNPRRLTHGPGYDGHPHWSADGERIVFNSDRTSPDPAADWSDRWHEIFSMRADGGDVQQHTRCRSVCTYGSLSPDGARIVYRKTVQSPAFSWFLQPGDRNSEVFVATLAGEQETNVSDSAAFDGWPVWSPAGDRIAFVSNRAGPAGTGHIYTVRPDGSGLTRITSDGWSYVQPAWSSDATALFAKQGMETSEYEFGDVVRIQLP